MSKIINNDVSMNPPFPPSGQNVSRWQVLSEGSLNSYTDSDWFVSPHLLNAPASTLHLVSSMFFASSTLHILFCNHLLLILFERSQISFVVKDPRVNVCIFHTKVVFPAADFLIKIHIPPGTVHVITRAASKYLRVAKNTRAFLQ